MTTQDALAFLDYLAEHTKKGSTILVTIIEPGEVPWLIANEGDCKVVRKFK